MRQDVKGEHGFDEQGNPAGGYSVGVGFSINWQNGALGRGENRKEPNGAFVEGVIQAALGRLEFYQSTKFACEENEQAIKFLRAALDVCDVRTAGREERKVEGTHQV